MIHIVYPKNLPLRIYHSQLLNLKKTLEGLTSKSIIMWVPESFSDLEENYYIYKDRKLDKNKISNGDIIYFRSPTDYFINRIYLFNKSVKYIYDFRAIVAFEDWYREKNIIRFILFFFMEWLSYLTAHQVNAVSNKLSEKLQSFFLFKRHINVIPCLTAQKIKLGTHSKNKINLVYIGGTSRWQCIEEIIKIYKVIDQKFNSSLTFYTKDCNYIKRLANKLDIKVECKFVDHKYIEKELEHYDFGFLIRENNIINEVASPVKFLEYMANGVIPIITNNIGDYSDSVIENKIGIIVNWEEREEINKNILKCLADQNIYIRMKRYVTKKTWDYYKTKFLCL